jgi:hypothetical protein
MLFHVTDRSQLTRRETLLLAKLEREYTPALLRDVLLPLINQTSPVSLRALDWAVVNWSKKHNIICSSMVAGEMVNIHHSYRKTLSFWKRRLFDPFRRRARIRVHVDGETHETTLGQANFALWSYKTGVLSYVVGHIDSIEADMNKVSKKNKRERSEAARRGTRRKRTELTQTPRAMCIAYNAPTTVHFS